jgi:hypothetical protein
MYGTYRFRNRLVAFNADTLSATLYALADPTRRAILARRLEGDASVSLRATARAPRAPRERARDVGAEVPEKASQPADAPRTTPATEHGCHVTSAASSRALYKRQKVAVEAIHMRDEQGAWRTFIHLELTTRYEVRRLPPGRVDGCAWICVTVDDQRGDCDLAQLRSKVGFDSRVMQVDQAFQRRLPALAHHPLRHLWRHRHIRQPYAKEIRGAPGARVGGL